MVCLTKDLDLRLQRIKMLLLDVDGILTSGNIIYDEEGKEIKTFCVKDGLGIKLLQQAGIKVGILSSRFSQVVANRAKELDIDLIFQGYKQKLPCYINILKKYMLNDEQIAYMGDDWVDIPILRRVGLAITVPEAWPPLKDFVHYVTSKSGGEGAVREVCDLILKSQGKWEELLRCFYD